MYPRRRYGSLPVNKMVIAIFMILVAWMTWHNASNLISSGDEDQALKVVEQFYKFEQVGDFGSSWELFHPMMQQQFEKAAYIQKRAHIVMQDFGVNTFQVEVGSPTRITDWKMSAESAPIPVVYEIIVTESFHSPYGNFAIVQPCYAAYDSGKWTLLWSYQADKAKAIQNVQ